MVFKAESGRSGARPAAQGKLPATARRLPRVLLVLLLFCFVLQGTAVQSHVHFAGKANPSVTAASHGSVLRAGAGSSKRVADCVLCQEAATAGAYVLPSSPALPPPPAALRWLAPAELAAFSLPAAPLGWLSRAPPK